MLELSPDDWCAEPKIDGARVVVCRAGIFTRHGTPLTKSKGLDALAGIIGKDFFQAAGSLTLEGEWVQRIGKLWLFDLPDHLGTHDERVATLADVVGKIGGGALEMPRVYENFPKAYADWKLAGHEGIVMKRRASRYRKCDKPGTEIRDWLKHRYCWAK